MKIVVEGDQSIALEEFKCIFSLRVERLLRCCLRLVQLTSTSHQGNLDRQDWSGWSNTKCYDYDSNVRAAGIGEIQ
ncbi:hypothetical protein H5410_012844 [Solanum commersonii]|uniref:Uncharacterized protein n=1 Tax=Solanum commersonii TaxID=4109 RepID=A0A9J6ATT0_SOLCO|nr:hypothetical protein H5410_012844 [Solanum commersonii]